MRERILSGALLLAFLAAVVVFNESFPVALNIVVGIISMLAVYELIKAMGVVRYWFITAPAIITAALTSLLFSYDRQLVFFIYCGFTAVLFLAMIRHYNKITFKEIAIVFSMVVLIPQALSTLVSLRELSEATGMFYMLIAILTAWIADAGAYFAGTFWGKHKLCPNISPKKTVEGLIGGVIIDVAAMLLFGVLAANAAVFSNGEEIKVNYIVLFAIGFVGALVSVLGDLSFSLIKRSCHVKDFGQVIPGHGGILDRFDSVIFTAPFVYIIVYYFPILTLI